MTDGGLWLVGQLVRRVLLYNDCQDFLRTQAHSIISHITFKSSRRFFFSNVVEGSQ